MLTDRDETSFPSLTPRSVDDRFIPDRVNPDRASPKKNVHPPPRAPPVRSEATSSSLFFKHNSALGPPYSVLVDTNFINFSIKNKIDLVRGMMDCLYAQCVPHVTDCVMAELEKLGQKYRVALRVAKDPRFVRLPCTHPGTYADDCIAEESGSTSATSSRRATRT